MFVTTAKEVYNGKECNACSNYTSCGRMCTLSELICTECGSKKICN